MKRKTYFYTDPRANHARSWRDMLPIQAAGDDDPTWLKITAVIAFLFLLVVMSIL